MVMRQPGGQQDDQGHRLADGQDPVLGGVGAGQLGHPPEDGPDHQDRVGDDSSTPDGGRSGRSGRCGRRAQQDDDPGQEDEEALGGHRGRVVRSAGRVAGRGHPALGPGDHVGQVEGVEVGPHVLADVGPHGEQDALALVVAGPVLVGERRSRRPRWARRRPTRSGRA